MSISEWWRKRRLRRNGTALNSRKLDEAAIGARVDMVCLEAFAEAAYDAMREAKLQGAKSRYEEARFHFDRAIEAAHRAHLNDEAVRLKRRRDHIGQVYNGQVRYSGDG
jgi:hypothetical protein